MTTAGAADRVPEFPLGGNDGKGMGMAGQGTIAGNATHFSILVIFKHNAQLSGQIERSKICSDAVAC